VALLKRRFARVALMLGSLAALMAAAGAFNKWI
jgi:hypothetical protein